MNALTRVEIRRIGTADIAVLDHVADDVFDGAIVPARFAAYLERNEHLMVLALDSGLVVGQCRAVIHLHPDLPTELYIDNLGVSATHRRRGIARQLIAEISAWGIERGCAQAWVATEPDNEPARALYDGISNHPAEIVAMYVMDL